MVITTKASPDGEWITDITVDYYVSEVERAIPSGYHLEDNVGGGEVKIADGVHWRWFETYKNMLILPVPKATFPMEGPAK